MSKEEIQKVWSEISDHKSQISNLKRKINSLIEDKINLLPIKLNWKEGIVESFNYFSAL